MRKIGKNIIVIIAGLLFTALPSCGYRFAPAGGIVPEGAKTIAIVTFVNGTKEPYVDLEVTKAVVNEFLTDGRLQVVGSESADLVLNGTVDTFNITPAAYTNNNNNSYVQSYVVSISINVSLEEVKTHKIILQEKGISSVFTSNYGVTLGDITATKTAKEAAIRDASRDIASTLRSRVLEGF